MDRTEQTGLGVAVVGHVALFALLSLGLVSTAKLPPIKSEPLDVVLVDEVGLQTAVPQPATEPPAPAEAPEPTPAPPQPAAAPDPVPTPPVPEPKPAAAPRSRDVPQTQPAEARPTPRAAPAREPRPTPRPAPAPEPKPKPAQREQVNQEDRRRPDNTRSRVERRERAAPAPAAPAQARQTPQEARASRLSSRMFANLSDSPAGKATAPRASAVSAVAMQGIAAAIKRQIQPCYELGALSGTPAMQIVTVMRLRFTPDGNVQGTPTVSEQTGVDASNRAYQQQITDVSRRAVLRCAPLRLPANLYEGGWEDIELTFRPGELG